MIMGNRVRKKLRQKFSYRLVVITGVSVLAIATGFFIYFQVSNPESSHAQQVVGLSQDALPVEMEVQDMVIAPADTQSRNGNYKVAKPLSLTPQYSN
jgi:hypothetical protein